MKNNTKNLLSTKEVSNFLGINEKMVYTLIAEKGLPATKITGKWLFPQHLVEQWIENNTLNYPNSSKETVSYQNLLIITGSNDILLDQLISLFNTTYSDYIAVFGNLGSMGGLKALRQNLCHIASSHLMQPNEDEYNFEFARQEINGIPAVMNFCKREQGLLVQKNNPKNIKQIADLSQKGIRIVNRPLGTGTRLLFDWELQKAGIEGEKLEGYHREIGKHLDVGLEVLTGRADAAPSIRSVASLLGLHFIPLRWERYDLLIRKERFFEKNIQLFLGLLHEKSFRDLANQFDGYNLETTGKMLYPVD